MDDSRMTESSLAAADASLTDRIRTVLPRLSGALRLVADAVLADPAGVARLSAVDLAGRAGVSQASVTRFAQSLGLASHAELRLALATLAGRSAVPGWTTDIGPQIGVDDTVGRLVTVVANADIRTITQTVDQLDLDALDRAARTIAAARRVDVYAVGGSATIAKELEMRLFRIGVQVRAWTEVHQATTSAALLAAGDVAIGVSHSGSTAEVVEPFRTAAGRGAATIGITSDPRSAIAAAAGEVLRTTVLETSFRSGGLAARHSQLVVADCLYIRVAQLTSDRAADAIGLTDHIAAAHSVSPRSNPRAPRNTASNTASNTAGNTAGRPRGEQS
jgi:DNA-binding MurR/RpiR family transcriptional regulator